MSHQHQFRHVLVIEDSKARRIVSLEESVYSIGRDPKNNIIIYDSQVSRYHATLIKVNDDDSCQDAVYQVIDGDTEGNHSTNGIIVNGKTCLQHNLQHGDSIRFGSKAKATYQIVDESIDSDIDLLRSGPSTKINRSKVTLNDESKQTLTIEDPQEQQEQEELVRLASFPELSPNPIIEIDWEGNVTYANTAASIRFKDLGETKLEHPILAGLVNNSQNKLGNLFVREVKIGNEVFEQYVHYLSERKLIRSYIFDFTKRKQIEAELRDNEAKYGAIVRQISEGIVLVEGTTKKILEANPAYCTLVGYSNEELLELTLDDLVVLDKEPVEKNIPRVLRENIEIVGESIHRRKDGFELKVEVSIGTISYSEQQPVICLVVRNVSNWEFSSQSLQYQSLHDMLTGLPNETFFQQQMEIAIASADRNKHQMAVVLVDIDNFAHFNNTLGHELADELLKGVAKRLRACLRVGDIVARLGGDDFAVILSRIFNVKDITKVARRISESFKETFEVPPHQITIKTSIGIAIYPQDGEDAPILLKRADTALQRSKKQAQGGYSFFGLTLNTSTAELLRLESLLSRGITQQEYFLLYQPTVNIKTAKITGMEVLLRWQHPELGTLLPSKFLNVLEESGLIIPVGEWIITTACAQNLAWQKAGIPPIPISVNLSPRQFQQPNLATKISQILESTGLEPHWLELEVTEASINPNPEAARKTLRELLQVGVHLCLDDFGYSSCSISYLKQIPFHTMKIDQAFIKDIGDTNQDRGILASLIAIGGAFNMKVVAEGVQSQQQLQILRSLDYQQIQGYLFSQPITKDEATRILRESSIHIPT